MKSEEEVLAFFKSDLQTSLAPLEDFRIKKVRRVKNILITALLLVILLVISIFTQIPFLIGLCILAIMSSLGFAYETLEKMKITLQGHFKSDILPKILEYLFHQFDYIPNQRIAKSVLTESQLISDEINVVEGEDFMRFKHDETGIMFCETTVFRRNKSDGPVFHGIFLVASFNKYFQHQTVVLPRSKVSFLSKFINYEIFNIFHEIKLEDVDFTKKFAVYSTDQVEARYILTPGFMERVLAYRQKVNRKISLSFVNDKMFCTIPNYVNLFEPAIFESFYEFNYFRKSYEALKLYNEIVDDLNLNLRIWSKR
jgi:hypothetical protein